MAIGVITGSGSGPTSTHSQDLSELATALIGRLTPLFWDMEKKVLVDSEGNPINVAPRGYPVDLKPSLRQGLRFTIESVLLYAKRLDGDAYCLSPNGLQSIPLQFYKIIGEESSQR